MSKPKVLYVSPVNTGATWPMIKKYVDRVLPLTRRRRMANNFLFDMINGEETLLVVQGEEGIIGFCSCCFVNYDDIRMLQVKMLAGDRFDDWIEPMHDAIEKMARENECDGMELIGRRGWVRKLASFGWREAFVTCEKRFDR